MASALDTLSPASRRIYLRTCRAWTEFADDRHANVRALTFDRIRAVVHKADFAKTARQNRLTNVLKPTA